MMVAAPAGSVPVGVVGGISTARARFAPTFDAAGAVVRRGAVFARFLVAAFVAVFFFFAAILISSVQLVLLLFRHVPFTSGSSAGWEHASAWRRAPTPDPTPHRTHRSTASSHDTLGSPIRAGAAGGSSHRWATLARDEEMQTARFVLRSVAVAIIAVAGDARAQAPQATHASRPTADTVGASWDFDSQLTRYRVEVLATGLRVPFGIA